MLKQLPEAQAFAQHMLGSQLVTYQTGSEGQYVSSILLCENIYPVRQELYFGMVVDRESQRVTFIVSPAGISDSVDLSRYSPELDDNGQYTLHFFSVISLALYWKYRVKMSSSLSLMLVRAPIPLAMEGQALTV